jgi:putative ABC transport system substrate-binding protein
MRIVFVGVSDPIGPGFVKSFDHPGGNITGFTMGFEETTGGKWLELLREIAPSVKWASMLFNPETANAGRRAPSTRRPHRSRIRRTVHPHDEI